MTTPYPRLPRVTNSPALPWRLPLVLALLALVGGAHGWGRGQPVPRPAAPPGQPVEPATKSLTPAEAVGRVGETVTVEFKVGSTGTNASGGGYLELYSGRSWQEEGSFFVRFSAASQEKFRKAGVDDVRKHFAGRSVRVTGVVTEATYNGSRHGIIYVENGSQIQITTPAAPAVGRGARDAPILTLEAGGHTGYRSALFTPDGKRVVSVSQDKSVRIWDTNTGEMLRVLRPMIGPRGVGRLYAAALAPDGKTLMVCASGATEKAYPILAINLDTERVERVFEGHEKAVTRIAFSADGRRLASASDDATVRIWDPKTGGCETILSHNKNDPRVVVHDLAWSPDGKHLASAGTEGLRVWSIPSGEQEHLLRDNHTDGQCYVVLFVSWSPDGRTIASGSADRTIRLWTPEGAVSKRYQNPDMYYGAGLTFTRDSKSLLFRDTMMDVATETPRAISDSGRRCVLSPDESKVAVLGLNRLSLYTTAGTLIRHLGNELRTPTAVGWGADGKAIGWGYTGEWPSDNQLHTPEHFLNLTSWETETTARKNTQQALTVRGDLTLSRADKGVAITNGGETLRVLESYYYNPFYCWTFIPGTNQVLCGGQKGLYLFDGRTGQRVRAWEDGTRVLAVSPSPDGRYVMTVSADQLIRVWKLTDEQPLLYLFSQGNDWIASTPEGYYAASPGGENLMGWAVSNGPERMASFYPAAHFRKTFYRPDIIKRVLEAGSVEKAVALADQDRGQQTTRADVAQVLPPVVAITSPAPSGTKLATGRFEVGVAATGRGQPVTSLKLLVDGRPHGDARAVRTAPGTTARETWAVDLPAGTHRLAAVATTVASQGVSDEVEVTIAPAAGEARPPSSNLHVLAVGINAYPGRMALDCAAPDAKAITDAFRTHGKGLYTVRDTLLLDKQATRAAILKELDALAARAKPGDVAVFYYAGHGDAKAAGSFHILPADVDVKRLADTGISGDELRARLGKLPCTALLIMDCCFAGSFDAKKVKKRALPTAAGDLVRELVSDDQGLVVMCGASKDQESGEESRLGHGYFTLALTEGLSGKAASKRDGLVYLSGLQVYVEERVRELSNDDQYPTMGRPTLVRSFPLSKP